MAHLRDLDDQCMKAGCTKRAVVELRATWNDSLGKYCRPHGNEQLKVQQAYEDREREEARRE